MMTMSLIWLSVTNRRRRLTDVWRFTLSFVESDELVKQIVELTAEIQRMNAKCDVLAEEVVG